MRALLQRVNHAEVSVDGNITGQCGRGLLILLGCGPNDGETEARRLWNKIYRLRIFPDNTGKMNLSLSAIGGEVLICSQFTLYADCRRGNRPSFTMAASPRLAKQLYDYFLRLAETDLGSAQVGHGIFGAKMQVSLVNDGPVTIWLDSDERIQQRKD